MSRTEVLFSKASYYSTLQQLLKSNLCAFLGLTFFKVLCKRHTKLLLPSHTTYDQASLFRQKLHRGWSERKDIFQGRLGKQAHTLHHVLSCEYLVYFLLPLISKRQIPSSLLTFYVSFHCTAIYIIHNTCPSDKHQEVRKGRGKNSSCKEDLIQGCSQRVLRYQKIAHKETLNRFISCTKS